MIKRGFRPGGALRGIATRCLVLLAGLCSAATAAAAVQITAIAPPAGWSFLDARAISNNGLVTGRLVNSTEPFNKPFLYSAGVTQIIDIGGSAIDINAEGQIVGSSGPWLPGLRAFRHQAGVTTWIDPVGASDSYASGINSRGHVVGAFLSPPGYPERGFIERNGQVQLLPDSGVVSSSGIAINNLDVVVGGARFANGTDHAFVYRDGVMHDIDPDPLRRSYAVAINDRGEVAGTVQDAFGRGSGFFYSGGVMTMLGTLPGWELSGDTRVSAINATGHIVGTVTRRSCFGCFESRAFIWTESGGMLDLNQFVPPQAGWYLETANDINDQGDIVGRGSFGSFVLTGVSPVPEPTVLASMLFGCALVLATARRRRTV